MSEYWNNVGRGFSKLVLRIFLAILIILIGYGIFWLVKSAYNILLIIGGVAILLFCGYWIVRKFFDFLERMGREPKNTALSSYRRFQKKDSKCIRGRKSSLR